MEQRKPLTRPRILVFKLKRKCAYGRYIYYPENEDAKIIVDLMGKSTYTQDQVEILQKLGVKMEIEIVTYVRKKRNWQKWEKNDNER